MEVVVVTTIEAVFDQCPGIINRITVLIRLKRIDRFVVTIFFDERLIPDRPAQLMDVLLVLMAPRSIRS